MREIKFRAWLLKENKIVFVDSLHNNKGYGGALEIIINNPKFDPNIKDWVGENRPCDSYLNHSMDVHKERSGGDDFVLMQYTWLKDNNGVDIYDGDILNGWRKGSNSDREHTGTIQWQQEQAGWVIKCGKYIMEILSLAMSGDGIITQLDSFEIIGNIYETPELLNSQS